jgi:hypothetical protein
MVTPHYVEVEAKSPVQKIQMVRWLQPPYRCMDMDFSFLMELKEDHYTNISGFTVCSCWGDPCDQIPGEGQPVYLACSHGDTSKSLVNLSSETNIIIGVTEWKEELYLCWDFDCINAVKCGGSRTKYDLNRQIHDQWRLEQVPYQYRPTQLCSPDVKEGVL